MCDTISGPASQEHSALYPSSTWCAGALKVYSVLYGDKTLWPIFLGGAPAGDRKINNIAEFFMEVQYNDGKLALCKEKHRQVWNFLSILIVIVVIRYQNKNISNLGKIQKCG